MTVVAIAVVGVALLTGIAVVLGLVDASMSSEPVDRPDDGLPDRPLTSQDVSGMRFRIGLRGYRMDDVDTALDRLRAALHDAETAKRDAETAKRDAEQRSEAVEPASLEGAAKPARTRRSAKPADPADPEA
ncbi:MAG TPA: DivIVA domain-containing protein [Mycobacteriales bacterium]|nr:DivIVA domain-containing protein [Mycobacteriales bacterium]